jgi:hypothetical protein
MRPIETRDYVQISVFGVQCSEYCVSRNPTDGCESAINNNLACIAATQNTEHQTLVFIISA